MNEDMSRLMAALIILRSEVASLTSVCSLVAKSAGLGISVVELVADGHLKELETAANSLLVSEPAMADELQRYIDAARRRNAP
jgi:hypothetical protein